MPGVYVAGQALIVRLFGQISDSVLEGIAHPTILEADGCVPLTLFEGLGPAASGLHPVEDFLFLGKQNVPPCKVIGESIYDLRATQSASNRSCFEERDVGGV